MAHFGNARRSRFSKSTLPAPSDSLADSGNKFSNDGSFMEMFKKQMEEKQREKDSANQKTSHEDNSPKSTTTTSRPRSPSATPAPAGANPTTVNSSNSKAGTSEALHASSSSDGTAEQTLAQKKMNYSFFVGKRRGSGPMLKTGAVKKAKVVKDADEGEAGKTDAWSHYLAEVQKYKSQSCQDEDRTRPLVK